MKIRNGFVTNSSSSSFLVFSITHPKLYHLLTSLGIKIKEIENNVFSPNVKLISPNGNTMELCEIDPDWMPTPQETSSITAWLMSVILSEVESLYPPKQLDEYTDFTIEILKLLNNKGIIQIDIKDVESWDRDMLFEQLERFDKMDVDIENAEIELNTGFEGEILHLETVSARNGYSLSIFIDENTEKPEETLENAEIVVLGEAANYTNKANLLNTIETHKGIPTKFITENTRYIICNNVSAHKNDIKKAEQWSIPVISEKGFMYRFGDKTKISENIYEELYECTNDGDFYEMFYKYGIGTVIRKKLN